MTTRLKTRLSMKLTERTLPPTCDICGGRLDDGGFCTDDRSICVSCIDTMESCPSCETPILGDYCESCAS